MADWQVPDLGSNVTLEGRGWGWLIGSLTEIIVSLPSLQCSLSLCCGSLFCELPASRSLGLLNILSWTYFSSRAAENLSSPRSQYILTSLNANEARVLSVPRARLPTRSPSSKLSLHSVFVPILNIVLCKFGPSAQFARTGRICETEAWGDVGYQRENQ